MGYIVLLACAAALIGASGAVLSTPPAPSPGAAVVDGDTSEWNLPLDFFTNMYRAGDPTKPLESKAYLRYDCPAHTVYALVLSEPGVPGLIIPPEVNSWIAIDGPSNKVVNEVSGDDGTPPDFAWVGLGYDGDTLHVRGYEASFPLAEGDYVIILHTKVFDGGGAQTSASPGAPGSGPALHLECPPTTGTENTSWSKVKRLYQ
jgi:hypothetical protein